MIEQADSAAKNVGGLLDVITNHDLALVILFFGGIVFFFGGRFFAKNVWPWMQSSVTKVIDAHKEFLDKTSDRLATISNSQLSSQADLATIKQETADLKKGAGERSEALASAVAALNTQTADLKVIVGALKRLLERGNDQSA